MRKRLKEADEQNSSLEFYSPLFNLIYRVTEALHKLHTIDPQKKDGTANM